MRHTPVAFSLALALMAGACSRPSPLAPATPPVREAGRLTNQSRVEERVVATLRYGANPYKVAQDLGCECIAWAYEEYCAAFVPPPGVNREAWVAVMSEDERIVTCEVDGYLEPAEVRQQSFSFDDGLGSHQTYAEQPAAAAIGIADAHRVGHGDGVHVAVLDTGIDPTHPALASALVTGHDFVDGDDDATDTPDQLDGDGDGNVDEAYGHGTHVAGIVMLVAPGARLMPVRVLDADGRGTVLSVAAGIRWAVNHGARVLNLSLGTLEESPAIQYALDDAEDAGCIVISSAGNWGASTPVEYPAGFHEAVAVGAVDVDRQPAPFTSYGSFVDLSAPGIGVRSAFPGNAYRLWSGTSMSAPFVSGVAALLVALHPGWNRDDFHERLDDTCRPVVGGTYAQRHGLGAGALDAGAALEPDIPFVLGPGIEPEPLLPIVRPRR